MVDWAFEQLLQSLNRCKYPISAIYHVDILIPDVVFFKGGNPDSWFFTDKVLLKQNYRMER